MNKESVVLARYLYISNKLRTPGYSRLFEKYFI